MYYNICLIFRLLLLTISIHFKKLLLIVTAYYYYLLLLLSGDGVGACDTLSHTRDYGLESGVDIRLHQPSLPSFQVGQLKSDSPERMKALTCTSSSHHIPLYRFPRIE